MADTVASGPPPSVPPPTSTTTPSSLVTPTRVVCAVLLLTPFVALLWVNSYARLTPAFIGIPFFYWYQLLWVVVSAVFTGIAYLLIRREESRRSENPGGAARSGSGEVGQ